MKKSLVLAMAMALGVTASAYAANPFSDVPAGHWAYDSIDKLAAAGVIDGMGDGTYQGDKTMTRYEMAQIVAKAMAKGANVDKLAAEFADELDNLGVRVANLEKKADNVKITGTISLHTRSIHGSGSAKEVEGVAQYGSNHAYLWRSDINIKGQINEDWTYSAMIRNDQKLDNDNAGKGEETPNFQRAWVDGKIGGAKVKAGRYHRLMGNGEVYAARVDGVEATYGLGKVKATAGYAQLSSGSSSEYGADAKVLFGEVSTQLNKAASIEVDYYAFKDMIPLQGKGASKVVLEDDANVFAATLNYNFSKNVKLTGTYLHSDAKVAGVDADKDGYAVKLAYKGASAAKPGSWGLYAKYVDLSKAVQVANNYTTNAFVPADGKVTGMKGSIVGANYAFAKNIVGTVEFASMEVPEKVGGQKINGKWDTLYAGLAFTF